MEKLTAEQFRSDISEVTLVSLNELMERKQEVDRLKRAVTKTGFFLILVLGVFLFYIYVTKQELLNHFTLASFRLAAQDPMVWLLILGLFFAFLFLQHFNNKSKEADDNYEALRYELIERSEELWARPDQWENRHIVFAFMDKEHDINLYYK